MSALEHDRAARRGAGRLRRRAVRVATAAAAVAAGAAAAATPALGAPAHVPAGRAIGEAQHAAIGSADGRWAAYVSRDAVLHVIDDADPRGSFTTSSHCVRAYSVRVTGGDGRLFVACNGVLRRFDIATRTWSDAPAAPLPPAARGFSLRGQPLAAGGRWLAFEPEGAARFYVDRETGAVRQDTGGATEVPDLDAPELLRALCAPLRRPLPASVTDPGPFGVTSYDGEQALAENGDMLTVQRCGEPRPTVVGAASPFQASQLSAGVVSWSARWALPGTLDAFAYLPRCRLRLSWSVAAATSSAHTSRALYVTRQPDSGPWSVQRIALPEACAAKPARLSLRVAGARRATVLRAGGWTAPNWSGAVAERLPAPGAAASLATLPVGRTVTLRTPARARGIAWSLPGSASGAARAARRGGREWRLRLPRSAAGAQVRLTVRGVAPGGGAALFDVRGAAR